jgi:hypothetical protein
MAWYSYTLASTIPPADIDSNSELKDIASKHADEERSIFTHSRWGAVFALLQKICAQSQIGTGLYLLNNSALLLGDEIVAAANTIQALLAAVEKDPGIVLEATKTEHSTSTEIHADGFEPLAVQVVYAESAVFKDGWVYHYSEEDVRGYLQNAQTSTDPCPDYDDEGEGLEYAFGILKSHLSLLQLSSESGLAFVFAEMN